MRAHASVVLEVAVALICFGLWFAGAPAVAAGEVKQRSAIEKHLRRLNKPAVKSIQSPDGDIVDCVSIAHQPAFDHPLLKNHTIQLRPSFHPEGIYDENKVASDPSNNRSNTIAQLWHQNGRCPEGTIPIKRTTTEDILRASSVKGYGKKKQTSIPRPPFAYSDFISHEHAYASVSGDEYYGTKAIINVWEPEIQLSNEFSLAQFWIVGGTYAQGLNTIEAGWMVDPELYGDYNTRTFIYWTSDSYQTTGCYNLKCSGFIQTNSEIAIGTRISPVSQYGGSQNEISILVWKDPTDGNWWMQFGSDQVMGYWPSSLFSYLSDSASTVQWGGEVINSEPDGQHTATQMGSGHFAEEGFSKASYFKQLQIVDESNNLRSPKLINTFAKRSNCYDIQYNSNSDWGSYFYFGGPGRNPNCP